MQHDGLNKTHFTLYLLAFQTQLRVRVFDKKKWLEQSTLCMENTNICKLANEIKTRKRLNAEPQ